MCLVDNEPTVLLGTGNGEIKTQSLSGEKWQPKDLTSITSRTVSQQGQANGCTYIWSGGSENGVVSDSSIYLIKNGQIKKEKLCGDIPSPRQEFAMCAGKFDIIKETF